MYCLVVLLMFSHFLPYNCCMDLQYIFTNLPSLIFINIKFFFTNIYITNLSVTAPSILSSIWIVWFFSIYFLQFKTFVTLRGLSLSLSWLYASIKFYFWKNGYLDFITYGHYLLLSLRSDCHNLKNVHEITLFSVFESRYFWLYITWMMFTILFRNI